MSQFPDRDYIRRNVSIVEVIGEYTELTLEMTPEGPIYVGDCTCCPGQIRVDPVARLAVCDRSDPFDVIDFISAREEKCPHDAAAFLMKRLPPCEVN